MTGNAGRQIRKFNPGTFQSDEEVVEQFVVRIHELNIILDVLRGNIGSQSCQHALVVAPRGRGKTMLLARATAEIRTSPDLARQLLPISFMEESQEIFSLTDFWLETLFHLGRECAVRDDELAQELYDRHASLSERWREQTLEDHALAAVLEAADRLDRKLVLMVENLQSLFKDVDQDFGWKLRGILQTQPQIMLLASATSRFMELDDAEQPFFEMFRTINLKPLTTDECRKLWKIVSGEQVSGREMRPLEILTGGSPRLLVIVAGFAQHRSLNRLMEELVMLIDEHTEYFRSHLEVLGKTERRVYIALLDLWQLSAAGEIAERARMDVRVVSTMLRRLIARGALVVEGNGKKRKYVAAEPLYCIYYKLRRGRGEAAIVESLIRFMSVFYKEKERTEMFLALISEGTKSPAMRQGLERAAIEVPELARILGITPQPSIMKTHPAEAVSDRDTFIQLSKEIYTACDQEAFESVIDIVDRSAAIQSPALDSLSQTFSAWSLCMKGDAYTKLGDLEAGLSTFEEVVKRFGASEDEGPHQFVAVAFIEKGKVREIQADSESALSAYEEVAKRFGTSEDQKLKCLVAAALLFKGDCLRELGNLESVLSAYKEIVNRFVDDPDMQLKRDVARALTATAHVQRELDKQELALLACKDVTERFSSSDDIELNQWVAQALNLRANILLLDMDNPESAIAALDELLGRFGSTEDVRLHWWVAVALHFKGDCLRELGNLESVLSVYKEIVNRFVDAPDLRLKRDVVRALTSSANVQRELGESELALLACNDITERFSSSDDVELNLLVAEAVNLKGDILVLDLDDPESAIAALDEFLDRFSSTEDVPLRSWIARILITKAEILLVLDRTRDVLRICGEFESRLHGLDGEMERKLTWLIRRLWTAALLAQKETCAAVEMFRSLYDAFVPGNDIMVHGALEIVSKLVAGGASVHELLDILSSDAAKADVLIPLVVALRQLAGEIVREPDEVLQVAADIRKQIQQMST